MLLCVGKFFGTAEDDKKIWQEFKDGVSHGTRPKKTHIFLQLMTRCNICINSISQTIQMGITLNCCGVTESQPPENTTFFKA
jgi:hypothetical protein